MRVLVVTIVHVAQDARIHNRQIRALVRAGHDVEYAAGFEDPDEIDGVTNWVLPRARGRDRLRSIRAARALLRRRGPSCDVVMLHDPELLLGLAGLRNLPPVVFDVHEDLPASLPDKQWIPRPFRAPMAAVARGLLSYAERRCRLMLAEESYRALFRGDHPVVPNLPWLPPEPTGPTSRRVVHLGRVSAWRGAAELIEVGRRLAEAQITLELIGPVDADVHVQVADAASRGWLRSTGFVPNETALASLDGALAGLSLLHDVPNYRDSMPTKVMEYQAWGVPVITTPLQRAAEVVRSAGSGVVVPFGDPGAVATVVLELDRDRERARRLAHAGRRDAEGGHSWDAVADRFVEFVEDVARSR